MTRMTPQGFQGWPPGGLDLGGGFFIDGDGRLHFPAHANVPPHARERAQQMFGGEPPDPVDDGSGRGRNLPSPGRYGGGSARLPGAALRFAGLVGGVADLYPWLSWANSVWARFGAVAPHHGFSKTSGPCGQWPITVAAGNLVTPCFGITLTPQGSQQTAPIAGTASNYTMGHVRPYVGGYYRYESEEYYARMPGYTGAPNPFGSPGTTVPLPGTVTPPRPAIRGRSRVSPRVRPQTRLSPLESPSGNKPDGPPSLHRPPPPGTQEDKWILPKKGALGALLKGYGALTEGFDAIDCMEKSVRSTGARRRRGERQSVFVGRALLEGHGDPLTFMECMTQEQAQDSYIGRLNRAVSNAAGRNPYYRRPVGPGFGGWGTRMHSFGS